MRKTLILLAAAVLLGAWAPAAADDIDVFTLGPRVEPNVVLLLDTSGSMSNPIDDGRKMDIAKSVVIDLIENVDGVRFGLLGFATKGARMIAPVGADREAMIDAVRQIGAGGGTPLGRAARDVDAYFRGEFAEPIEGSGGQTGPVFPSPIAYECQQNHVIVMTDGMPTGESVSLVVDVAERAHATDHSSFPGMQNLVVHTIGFDVPEGRELLTETARKGGGRFYTASGYAELYDALLDALTIVVEQSYAFASPLIPTTSAADGDKAYMATFRPQARSDFWPGFLAAYERGSNGRIPLDAEGRPQAEALAWEAGELLAARPAASRTILTAVDGDVRPFARSNAALTPDRLGVSTADQRDRVIDYIRGLDAYDGDGDGSTADERDWKLGDTIHSAPVLVFPPPLVTRDEAYLEFKRAHAERTSVLLVGANDGMLHAFRASDGRELWGFVPPDLLDDLSELTGALGEHRFFVDASPIVADLPLGGEWRTVSVFGERRGGRSYHALDVTDTTSPDYLWEATDGEMGETWSEPSIARIKMEDGGARPVAFVGGGYDTEVNNRSGRAVYAIDLEDGAILWKYHDTGSGDSRHMNFSVAASPRTVDLDGDGFTDRVYVGDVGGQLWKFDVSAPATLSGGRIANWTGKRLFAADAGQDNPPSPGEYRPRQAMYATPALARDDSGALWVFLGTGDRNRPRAAAHNRIYGIKDDADMAQGDALTEADLVDSRSGDEATRGWYLRLGGDEKVWQPAEVFNRVVYVSSYTPENVVDCESAGGFARLYALEMTTGRLGIDWTDGHPPDDDDASEPRWTDAGDGVPTPPDVTLGDGEDGVTVITSEGEITTVDLPGVKRKRLRYWREVF